MSFERTDSSKISRWWWTIDRANFAAIVTLMLIGALLSVAASPAVAENIGFDSFHFVRKHQIFLLPSLGLLCFISLFDTRNIRRMASLMLVGSLFLMLMILIFGDANKGATRWIKLAGFTLQPSEFMKPALVIFSAWMFAEKNNSANFPGFKIAFSVFFISVVMLIMQPDFGMSFTVSVVFIIQFFLAGMPFLWVVAMVAIAIIGGIGAYYFLPHVAKRIDSFWSPELGSNYQVKKSLEAFNNGGLFGRGVGEGQVKQHIPDAHTDFIFAVAGEEYGAIICTLIICIFAFIVFRGFKRIWKEEDLFSVLSVVGLLSQFAIQAIINMGVAVKLFPAKGMTLPFISYGGSSMFAVSIAMGMMLALTKTKYGKYKIDIR